MADVEDHERAQIIALLEQGLPSAEVARRLGTRTIRVAAIKAHMTVGSYADLSADRPGVSEDVHGSGVRATLDDSQRAEIRALLAEGLSTAEIARQLGVRPMRVAAIKAHVTMGTYGEISLLPQPRSLATRMRPLEWEKRWLRQPRRHRSAPRLRPTREPVRCS